VTWGTPNRAVENIRGIRTANSPPYFQPYDIRANSYPSMAVSQITGHIYIVWTNIGVPGVNTGDPDIYLIKSTNGGNSWSTPVRVNDDPQGNGANQWFPWMTVDPVTDAISMVFYDGRNHIGTTSAEITVAHSTGGGATFRNFVISDNPFTVGPLPGFVYHYNGDYIGIAARNGAIYPSWNAQVPGLNSQAWMSPVPLEIEVTVEQRRESGQLLTGTSVGRWEGGPNFAEYEVPAPFNFMSGTTEVLRGSQEKVSNPDEKYHRWTINLANDDPDVRNHHEFGITSDMSVLTSQFSLTYEGAVIKNDLLSAPGQNGGTIDFKDPWFIDYPDPDYGNNLRNRGMDDSGPDALRFWTRSSPFNPDFTTPYENGQEYLGVFLDQGWPNWDPPYYSVRVPQTQTVPFHGQNITWYFRDWEGDEVDFQYPGQTETAVVFHLADAEARALYKGHLASSNSAATAHNNGRRVVRDEEYVLHAVYEDNKQIWYTYSTDGGEHWSAEELVEGSESDIGAEYLYPAIAQYDGKLHVTYTELFYIGGEISHFRLFYQSKNISGGQWPGGQELEIIYDPEIIRIPKPAVEIWKDITAGDEYVVIVINRINASSQIVTYYKELGGGSFQSLPEITGIDPSLGTDEEHRSFRLSYNIEDDIFIRKLNTGPGWSVADNISGNPWWLSWNRYSSITYSELDDRSHIVWTSQDDTRDPIVAYRNFRSLANPGQLTYFYCGDINAHPTVAVDESSGQVTIFYENNGTIIGNVKSGDYWTSRKYSPGWYPNIAGHGNHGAIWTTESSPPYRIQSDRSDPDNPLEGGDPLAEDTLMINKRLDFTFMQDTTVGHLTLHLENLDAGSRWLQFNRRLHTRQITIPPNAAARFNLRCRFHNLTFPVDTMTVLFNISFDEGNVVRPLGTLRVKDLLAFNDGQYHNIPKTIPMGFLAGKRGQLKLSFGENSPVISDVVVRRDSGEVRISLGKAGGEEGLLSAAIPTEFNLHQNYPNPFNPATTISFDLPEDAAVNLQIYDITGRKVRTLADHPFPAGVHQMVWDGRDERGAPVSSGIYVYRIEAGSYSNSHKMVLMR